MSCPCGVNREEITSAEASIGLTTDDLIATSIEGLQLCAPEIDL
ncbi:MAG: hypothetical protein ACJ758_06580 [Actinomycetota bacterium]